VKSRVCPRLSFRFRLKIGYQLNGRDLTVAWRVENLNEKEMPFAIGAHPGFMMPGDESHVFRLYDRQGKPVQSIENRIFEGGGCVTDRTDNNCQLQCYPCGAMVSAKEKCPLRMHRTLVWQMRFGKICR
jgi:hypothetical protein